MVNRGYFAVYAVPLYLNILRGKLNSSFSSYQEGKDNALVSQLIVVAVKELEYIIEFIKLDGIGEICKLVSF